METYIVRFYPKSRTRVTQIVEAESEVQAIYRAFAIKSKQIHGLTENTLYSVKVALQGEGEYVRYIFADGEDGVRVVFDYS